MNTKISPRRELIRLIRHIPDEKIINLIRIAKEFDTEELTEEDITAIRAGEDAVARGETISLEEFCRREGI